MKDVGWIKLYRKVTESDVFFDDKAFKLFIWLLANIDRKTSSVTFGRYQLAREIKINDSTLYKALKRLEKKYKMVTTVSNRNYTEVRLLNWDKYQEHNKMVTTTGNNKVTGGEQESNTLQEGKNKEYKKERDIASLKYLESLPLEDVEEFHKRFDASREQIALKATSLMNYCLAHGKVYRNYRAMLLNALMRDFKKRVAVVSPIPQIELTPGEQQKAAEARERLKREVHEKLGGRFAWK